MRMGRHGQLILQISISCKSKSCFNTLARRGHILIKHHNQIIASVLLQRYTLQMLTHLSKAMQLLDQKHLIGMSAF